VRQHELRLDAWTVMVWKWHELIAATGVYFGVSIFNKKWPPAPTNKA
jgi:hypothetical protein